LYAVSYDHRAYCRYHAGWLTITDTARHAAVSMRTTSTPGKLPRGLCLSPDGKLSYVTNFGDGTLSVIDTTTRPVVTTVDLPGYPDAVVVRPRQLNTMRRYATSVAAAMRSRGM
jgi:YVTN family beta-propeller protein